MHKLLTFAGRCSLVHMQLLDGLLFWWLLSFVVCICVERERKKVPFSVIMQQCFLGLFTLFHYKDLVIKAIAHVQKFECPHCKR